jgi:hypothetical protein
MRKFARRRGGLDPELLAWVGGLFYLALVAPEADRHFSFCILKAMGFAHCPGCGLGRSISWLLHGNLGQSFQTHPLGGPAVAVLTGRILSLLRKHRPITPTEAADQGREK